jgi:hypothetical protein
MLSPFGSVPFHTCLSWIAGLRGTLSTRLSGKLALPGLTEDPYFVSYSAQHNAAPIILLLGSEDVYNFSKV